MFEVVTPIVYEFNWREVDVVFNPETLITSLLFKLWGFSAYIVNEFFSSPEKNSTLLIVLVAVLTRVTDFPFILETFAAAPYPLVPLSSNIIELFTL